MDFIRQTGPGSSRRLVAIANAAVGSSTTDATEPSTPTSPLSLTGGDGGDGSGGDGGGSSSNGGGRKRDATETAAGAASAMVAVPMPALAVRDEGLLPVAADESASQAVTTSPAARAPSA